MKRLYSLDFLKLVFAYVIACFHFGRTIAPGPTVTVQIFFFISGFFLARKYYARSHADGGIRYTPWNYTLDHVKGIYPHYVFGYAAYLLYETARTAGEMLRSPSLEQVREVIVSFYDQIPNLLFLQSAYHFHDNRNYPLWQLSALVIGGYFVYTLLCHNERLSRQLIFPAGILMVLSLRHSGIDLDGTFGFFYMPLLRAFCGLSFGALVYFFTTTPYYETVKKNRILWNLAVLLAPVCIFAFAEHANIHFVTGAVLILGCFDERSWLNRLLNHKIFRHCGKLSLSIYINHALICRFTQGFLFSRLESRGLLTGESSRFAAYLVILTVYSVITMTVIDAWCRRRKSTA